MPDQQALRTCIRSRNTRDGRFLNLNFTVDPRRTRSDRKEGWAMQSWNLSWNL